MKYKKYKCQKINLRNQFSIFFLSYFLRVFLWNLGWPGTHALGQAGTEFWILLSQPPRESVHAAPCRSLSCLSFSWFSKLIVTWQFHRVYNGFWLLPPISLPILINPLLLPTCSFPGLVALCVLCDLCLTRARNVTSRLEPFLGAWLGY